MANAKTTEVVAWCRIQNGRRSRSELFRFRYGVRAHESDLRPRRLPTLTRFVYNGLKLLNSFMIMGTTGCLELSSSVQWMPVASPYSRQSRVHSSHPLTTCTFSRREERPAGLGGFRRL